MSHTSKHTPMTKPVVPISDERVADTILLNGHIQRSAMRVPGVPPPCVRRQVHISSCVVTARLFAPLGEPWRDYGRFFTDLPTPPCFRSWTAARADYLFSEMRCIKSVWQSPIVNGSPSYRYRTVPHKQRPVPPLVVDVLIAIPLLALFPLLNH